MIVPNFKEHNNVWKAYGHTTHYNTQQKLKLERKSSIPFFVDAGGLQSPDGT